MAESRGNKRNSDKQLNNILNHVTATASQAYMRNITDFDLLSIEEENQLAADIRNNDNDSEAHRAAKAKLIKANLRLVVKLAGEFINRGISKHDLIAEGNIGLMTAAEKFNPEKGAKFSTYSSWWIKQAMHRAIVEQSRTIRVPVQALEKISRINKAIKSMSQDLGRSPSDVELAKYLEISHKTLMELRNTNLSSTSLNDVTVVGENGEIQSLIPDKTESMPDQILNDSEKTEMFKLFFSQLPQRERQVLELRFGLSGYEPMTLESVGEKIGCTRERVRQIQNNALRILKALHEGAFNPER